VDGVPAKKWFAVLWGKSRQISKLGVADAVAIVQKYIPVISTCVVHCDENVPVALNLVNVSAAEFRSLLSRAVVVIGAHAPEQGTTVPEALACGTFVVARGRNLGYEFASHPLTRRFRKPKQELDAHVRSVLTMLQFDFGRSWQRQRNPPNLTLVDHAMREKHKVARSKGEFYEEPRNYYLPERYTSPDGHARHIREIFGISESCMVIENKSFVQKSLGVPLRAGWKCPK
jgi:hypothetical protein